MNVVTTIPDRLFIDLEESIIEGRLAVGSKISEPELSRQYGVSRGALREAIARLESCGLVERKPNVGARVVSLSHDQLIEIYHVREALEGMAARQAALAITEKEIAELRALLVEHQTTIKGDDKHAYFQKLGDLDFHFRIVKGSHNSHLIDLLCNDLYHLVRLYRCQFGMQSSKRGERAFSEHEIIIDAIERGDAETAEFMMRAHVRASRENVERLFEQSNQAEQVLGSD